MLADPKNIFHSTAYLLHNEKRLEHLASLNLPIEIGETVLEVGAGIGDHTSFFIDRGCVITTTEGRPECYKVLEQIMGDKTIVCFLDLENPTPNTLIDKKFDIVYCYGTLYHLSKPWFVLEYLSQRCKKILLLETCVSCDSNESVNLCEENISDLSQSLCGYGCRPTRQWLMTKLKILFDYVYMPITQPDHIEFPENWSLPSPTIISRSIFICSKITLENQLLTTNMPIIQQKYIKGSNV